MYFRQLKLKGCENILQISPVQINTGCISKGNKQIVYYPQIAFYESYLWEAKMNHMVIEQVRALISLQVGNMPTTVEEMLGLYEIKNNQRQVLSLSLSNYTYHKQAAHGMTYIKSLTFDLENKQVCYLADLFTPGSDYVQLISSLIKEQIQQRDIPLLNEFTEIQPNQDFYIADKVLVIYFQLYEITPYVVGLPMFPISVFDLIEIINENGPLGRMAVNN